MGILTDAFGKLFGVIWDSMVWLFGGLIDIFQPVIDILTVFWQLFFDISRAILYLIYMIGVLAVLLFQVLFEAGAILWSVVVGFAQTLSSLFYSPLGSSGHGYSEMITRIFDALEPLQIDVIA